MGTNSLETKSANEVVSTDSVNQYKTALSEDHVPRNASGVATDESGSIGTSAFRWLKGWFTSIGIGASASNNTIGENSGDMEFKRDGTAQALLKSTGFTRSSISPANYDVSDNINDSTTSTSLTGVTNSTVNISPTRVGAVIMLIVVPRGDLTKNNFVRISGSSFDTIYTGEVELREGTNTIGTFEFAVNGSDWKGGTGQIVGYHIATTTTTNDFSLRFKAGPGGTIYINGRLMAVEL